MNDFKSKFIFCTVAVALFLVQFFSDKPIAASFILWVLLVLLSYVDIKTLRLPNILNALLLISGGAYVILSNQNYLQPLLSFGISLITLGSLSYIFKRIRKKQGLGLGDIKLFVAGSVWLSPFYLPLCLLITSLSAIVIITMKYRIEKSSEHSGVGLGSTRFALGPFLSLGIWISWLFGRQIMGF